MAKENPCYGCAHFKDDVCFNRNRIAEMVSHIKHHLSEERYFTASILLMTLGNMKIDFEQRGFTSCSRQRTPTCHTFISTDEDFNKEAGLI